MRSLALAALLCLQGAAWGGDETARMQRGEELVMGRCFLCHGATGDSSSPLYPKLAGQHTLNIETQLTLFEERRRTDDNAQMQDVAKRLTTDEVRAVAEYLRGL
jgi:cytochrome c553